MHAQCQHEPPCTQFLGMFMVLMHRQAYSVPHRQGLVSSLAKLSSRQPDILNTTLPSPTTMLTCTPHPSTLPLSTA